MMHRTVEINYNFSPLNYANKILDADKKHRKSKSRKKDEIHESLNTF